MMQTLNHLGFKNIFASQRCIHIIKRLLHTQEDTSSGPLRRGKTDKYRLKSSSAERLHTIEKCAHVLHITHVSVIRGGTRSNELHYLLAQAPLNIGVLSQHVKRECEQRACLGNVRMTWNLPIKLIGLTVSRPATRRLNN